MPLYRFINHSKKEANCKATIMFVVNAWHVMIYATRTIEYGEELWFDYGDNYDFSINTPTPQQVMVRGRIGAEYWTLEMVHGIVPT